MDAVMATAARIVYPQIVKTPGVRGGKARIEGTRSCVLDVAFFHKAGLTPEQIQGHYADLNLAQIHAALAYYYANTGEIEAELAAEEQAAEDFEREKAEALAERARRTRP
jgi:uncharacterized protein (DUF433 family)